LSGIFPKKTLGVRVSEANLRNKTQICNNPSRKAQICKNRRKNAEKRLLNCRKPHQNEKSPTTSSDGILLLARFDFSGICRLL
jgi:hypothetical protein